MAVGCFSCILMTVPSNGFVGHLGHLSCLSSLIIVTVLQETEQVVDKIENLTGMFVLAVISKTVVLLARCV